MATTGLLSQNLPIPWLDDDLESFFVLACRRYRFDFHKVSKAVKRQAKRCPRINRLLLDEQLFTPILCQYHWASIADTVVRQLRQKTLHKRLENWTQVQIVQQGEGDQKVQATEGEGEAQSEDPTKPSLLQREDEGMVNIPRGSLASIYFNADERRAIEFIEKVENDVDYFDQFGGTGGEKGRPRMKTSPRLDTDRAPEERVEEGIHRITNEDHGDTNEMDAHDDEGVDEYLQRMSQQLLGRISLGPSMEELEGEAGDNNGAKVDETEEKEEGKEGGLSYGKEKRRHSSKGQSYDSNPSNALNPGTVENNSASSDPNADDDDNSPVSNDQYIFGMTGLHGHTSSSSNTTITNGNITNNGITARRSSGANGSIDEGMLRREAYLLHILRSDKTFANAAVELGVTNGTAKQQQQQQYQQQVTSPTRYHQRSSFTSSPSHSSTSSSPLSSYSPSSSIASSSSSTSSSSPSTAYLPSSSASRGVYASVTDKLRQVMEIAALVDATQHMETQAESQQEGDVKGENGRSNNNSNNSSSSSSSSGTDAHGE